MPQFSGFLLGFLHLLACSAAPMALVQRQAAVVLSSTVLVDIAPQSSTCTDAPHPAECRTASQALEPIVASFITYGITSEAEMAAVISLIAFETADFKYQNNYYPGNPGQGSTFFDLLSLLSSLVSPFLVPSLTM